MRLKSVFISEYKNLKNFSLIFDGNGFIDIFVGKNGSGKSNFLEALINIFDHVYDDSRKRNGPKFDYDISWDIDGVESRVTWLEQRCLINGLIRGRLEEDQLPSNIIIYYSGQNTTVAELVNRHRARYRRKIKNAAVVESPRFFGIGPEYKSLLLSLMLMLPEHELARQFLVKKLGIELCGETALLTLRRPAIVRKKQEFEPRDDRQVFWGTSGIVRKFLDRLLGCIPGDFNRGDLYDGKTDTYTLGLSVEKFRQEFEGIDRATIFSEFNALHTLGMIKDISIPVHLNANTQVSSRAFSDGQFQSVYIFAISEIFKDRNCITLLDEPDAFLHPEWQHDYLTQIQAISEGATKTNHILMSSHSASTIASKVDCRLRIFEYNDNKTEANERDKAELIKSLSAGLITFSETEARLNIKHNVKNTTGPILFTEGISDEIILETAWNKLNPGVVSPFEIQSAFSASFLRVVLLDETLYAENPARKFFGIFDFDEAYNSWNINGIDMEVDPERCLTKKRANCEGYFMLLPVPACLSVRAQVVNQATGQHYGPEALLQIELMFRDVPGLEANFEVDSSRPGNCIRFKGKKTRFASQIVPKLDAAHFEVFRPIFTQIQSRL
jgi:predicted ATPase